MKCPRCTTVQLKPTMIEEYLPAMACGNCSGSLVSLLYYRHWAENQKPSEATQSCSTEVETDDAQGALKCPKCSRIMTKYKVSGAVSNRLDVCPSCDEAWLDKGEWELLEALQLSHKMPAIFTDAWQRRIRSELSEETRRDILIRTIGAEDAVRVEEFRKWLEDKKKNKTDILVYLYK